MTSTWTSELDLAYGGVLAEAFVHAHRKAGQRWLLSRFGRRRIQGRELSGPVTRYLGVKDMDGFAISCGRLSFAVRTQSRRSVEVVVADMGSDAEEIAFDLVREFVRQGCESAFAVVATHPTPHQSLGIDTTSPADGHLIGYGYAVGLSAGLGGRITGLDRVDGLPHEELDGGMVLGGPNSGADHAALQAMHDVLRPLLRPRIREVGIGALGLLSAFSTEHLNLLLDYFSSAADSVAVHARENRGSDLDTLRAMLSV